MKLTELWQQHGRNKYYTDKGDGHSYLQTYDTLFESFQHKPVNIFEIGHSAGGSLRLFDDYFTHPDTKIIGIDQSDNDWLTMYKGAPYETNRVKTYLKDVHTLNEDWFRSINFIPDIVIEDSNHQLTTQVWVIRHILPIIRKDGILIVEDVIWEDERKEAIERLAIPFELIDLNHILYTRDNALLIFRND
jgi:hypothetical protein